jgi:hypothetical protein
MVWIDQIDGFEVGFPSSGAIFNFGHQAQPWDKAGKVWVAPGKHTFVLSFDRSETEAQSNWNHPGTGTATDISATGTVDAELAAHHAYRFVAWASGTAFSVTLWDETGGFANRSNIGNWIFSGRPNVDLSAKDPAN